MEDVPSLVIMSFCAFSDFACFIFLLSGEIEESASLFLYPPGKDHKSYHNDTFTPLMNVELSVLYPPCEDVDPCRHDFEVSGRDPEMAAATLGAYNDFMDTEMAIEKSTCAMWQ